jgi:lipid A ethanolaminephosphotransferase
VAVTPFFKEYASMVRNHREIRYLLTPVNYLQSLYTYVAEVTSTPAVAAPLGEDAAKGAHWAGLERKVITVLVVGETARADHFSLDGYARETNPQLARRDIVNFSNVSSCGTATRVSLPCMFSNLGRAGYSHDEAKRHENLLDVLNHAGIPTLWLDNNSGCKGVCDHSPTWTAAGLEVAGLCEDGECYDTVLLEQLERAIAGTEQDTLIVLHQNGSHGPAYYRRYPEQFRRFTPDCRSDDFADCTREEIVNSYDNTIYYTDYFLSRVIDLLDSRSAEMDTALMYVSDHGESLGEYGLYLHGTPYFLAPEGQTRVPMLAWMSSAYRQDFGFDLACLQGHQAEEMSHDNLFHSMLGMLDIETAERDRRLDLFSGCTAPGRSTGFVIGG